MSDQHVSAPPRSQHAAASFQDQHAERGSRLDRLTLEGHEAATSGHIVRMIDFFFALVLVQGVLRSSAVFEAPWHSNGPMVLALVTIYYTVIRSFVGWHAAIEQRRYRLFTEDVRTTELWRVYIDVLIVIVYAYMLLSAEPLAKDPGHDLARLLWAFPMLFALYAAWGQLRRAAWGGDDFRLRVLGAFFVLYCGLALGYVHNPLGFHGSATTGNVLALVVALGLMVAYRYINFWQGYADVPRWCGIRRPKLPNLRTLPDG